MVVTLTDGSTGVFRHQINLLPLEARFNYPRYFQPLEIRLDNGPSDKIDRKDNKANVNCQSIFVFVDLSDRLSVYGEQRLEYVTFLSPDSAVRRVYL